jgi:RNA polymerase sigma-70 factor (ECF subfamily)
MKDEDSRILTLVENAKNGNDSALSELIDILQPRLLRFCYYLCGHKELAEDICQDSLIKVLTKINSLKNSRLFIPWIFRAAKNRFLDHIKSHKVSRTESIENKADFFKESETNRAYTLIGINEMLSRLDDDERYILLLVDQQGYSYKEAAEIIGVSEAALTSRLHRIRKILLKKVKEI